MQYINFPGTSEKVSTIGLGTWVLGAENWGGAQEAESVAVVEEAVSLGMNFIDTAPFYGDGLAERVVGKATKKMHDKVFIATKCGLVRHIKMPMIDLSVDSIMKEIDQSRERLQCDRIDLYQCHWPDKNTPVEESMETLLKLQSQRKIRFIGVCNFDTVLLKRALKVAPIKTCQVPYSLLDRAIEAELLPFCLEKGIGVITYGPMGGGILTGKYQNPPKFGKFDARSMFYKFYQGQKFQEVQAVIEELKNFGQPLNQLALNWVRQQPGVLTVLAGCRNSSQVRENVAAADWDLSPQELEKSSRCLKP
jgi:aryl-alcohol dehydrogenase-like predicted oxidoreductase